MAWDATMQKVWVKAIGTVESSMNYSAINYNDPITVGIGQWYGTRAAAILNKMRLKDPTGYNGVSAGFRSVLEATPETHAFWNTYYLSRNFGDTIKNFLVRNKEIQSEQLIIDANAYKPIAEKYGIDIEAETEVFVLFCVAYHQSPQRAMRIMNRVGGNVSLEGLRSALLSDGVLGQYSNRYNTAYNIIKSRDISGVEGGNSPTPTPDGNGGKPSSSNNASVAIAGGNAIINVDGSYLMRLRTKYGDAQAVPYGVNQWICKMDKINSNINSLIKDAQNSATPSPPPTPSPGGDGSKGAKALQWMMSRIGKFAYRQAPGRLDPDHTGFGDCSSTVYRAYKDTSGTFVGTWTGDQYFRGRDVMGRGGGAMTAAQRALLKPGDLIVMAWRSTGSYYPETDHVEMVVDSNRLIGHGGNPYYGPVITSIDRLAGTRWWTVRRYD
jgi:cell wall-associated NlpC family hydrolase